MAARKLLVVGATGQQGGALIDALLTRQADFSIYGLTRNPTSPSAMKLIKRNVTMIEGDLLKSAQIFEKIGEPVWGVFCVTPLGKTEEKEGKLLVDAAVANGVQHFVFTSVDRGGPSNSDHDPTPVPHFISKYNVEKHLLKKAGSGSGKMQWTILRPVTFMDNFTPGFLGKLMTRILEQMGDVKLQFISTEDIGKAAARVFEYPERYRGKALTLAGDRLNYKEMDAIFKEEVGISSPIAPSLAVTFVFWVVSSDIRKMAHWFNQGGYAGTLDRNENEFDLKDFRTWLRTSSKWETKA